MSDELRPPMQRRDLPPPPSMMDKLWSWLPIIVAFVIILFGGFILFVLLLVLSTLP